jgi:hypothetical protein
MPLIVWEVTNEQSSLPELSNLDIRTTLDIPRIAISHRPYVKPRQACMLHLLISWERAVYCQVWFDKPDDGGRDGAGPSVPTLLSTLYPRVISRCARPRRRGAMVDDHAVYYLYNSILHPVMPIRVQYLPARFLCSLMHARRR